MQEGKELILRAVREAQRRLEADPRTNHVGPLTCRSATCILGFLNCNAARAWVANRTLHTPSASPYLQEYLGHGGSPGFCRLAAELALGPDSGALAEGRVASIQGISGTGSLWVSRVALPTRGGGSFVLGRCRKAGCSRC